MITIQKIISVIVLVGILMSGINPKVDASFSLNSSFLKNSLTAFRIISSSDYGVKVNQATRYKGFSYEFFTGVSMIGIKTYNRNEIDILNDFRRDFNILVTDPYIVDKDVLVLDEVLKKQEDLNRQRVDFYRDQFPWIDISSDDSPLSKHYEASIYMVLSYLPLEHVKLLRNVNIHYDLGGANGYGAPEEIIIRGGYLIDTNKFLQVFLHEMGHIVDTGLIGNKSSGISGFMDMNKKLYNNDPSIGFFSISWENEKKTRSNINIHDFVSEYAYSENSFEDFAESYITYVAKGNEFRCMTNRSHIIQEKYIYLKNNIFSGREYFTGNNQCSDSVIKDATD